MLQKAGSFLFPTHGLLDLLAGWTLSCAHILFMPVDDCRAKYNALIYEELTQLEVVTFGDIVETIVGVTVRELMSFQSLVCTLYTPSLMLTYGRLTSAICRIAR